MLATSDLASGARHWLAAAGLALLAGPLGAAPAAPPAVNLHVQWRWVENSAAPAVLDSAGQAGVVLATGGSRDPRGALGWRARQDERREAVQQLWLRNGGRASVQLATLEPIGWLEMAHTPQGGRAVLRYRWIESVTGLALRALWPGGQRSVEVELAAQTAQGGSALGAPGRAATVTQLLVPKGQWVTVARSAAAPRASAAGPARPAAGRGKSGATTSTRDVAGTPERELQLRIVPMP